ncbi:MAG TPA: MBL fold metallo-hydrolase [Anaerolineaceae bacterium]|nr:MBL fold metallo-hydrolase [Anaerolineaceae bacterium]
MQIDPQVRRKAIIKDLQNARSGYPDLWRRVTDEWRTAENGHHAWLTYAANYLFSFDGFKWALDPFAMPSRIKDMPFPDYRVDLAALSLIVLTHAHNDHLDVNLVRALKDTGVEWVIPVYVQDVLQHYNAMPEKNVITPAAGEEIKRGGIRLLPFESLHRHGGHGVPETGYLVESAGGRWLFPGDIRYYDITRLPGFGRLDGAVAHLWLGKAGALDAQPPKLDAFCDFFTGLDVEHLFITHLNEFGRDERDLWCGEHFELAKAGLNRRKPGLRVAKYLMGDRMTLNPVTGKTENTTQ